MVWPVVRGLGGIGATWVEVAEVRPVHGGLDWHLPAADIHVMAALLATGEMASVHGRRRDGVEVLLVASVPAEHRAAFRPRPVGT